MAAAQHRPERNGEGIIRLYQRKQFNNHEKVIEALYATHLMGWERNLPR
jgi:hypothetical protein